ncbi:unnamed protein product, partial [Effrenium voratum]
MTPVRSPRRPKTSEGCQRRFSGHNLGATAPLEDRSPNPLPPRPSSSCGGSRSTTASPAPGSPRPPSSPSPGQASPLSRRAYDLKPRVPSARAPSPYQANATPPMQNAALLARITQMRFPEASSVVQSLLDIDGPEAHELPVLCDAFHGRLGEIFSTLPLASLSQAAELLVSLAELADKRMPALKPEAQLNGIIEVRLNYFIHQSTRILDTKVDNSVHKTRLEQGGMLQELDHLLKCYQHAENLAREGIASLKSVKKALEHLLRLVENVPLVDLQHRAGELRSTGESCLEELLLARMRQVSLRNRQQVDCKLVAEALLEIHRKLDLPQLDREVEDTIAWEVPAMVKMWSLDRLQFECETKAGLQILAQASSRVWECANAEVSNRLLGWVCESVSNLRQSRNLDTAQAAILRWKKMTQRAIGSGLVIFAPEARTQTIDMFSRCYDDFVSSRDSSASADEIDRLLFQVAVIMGVDRKGDAEQLRK